jgi:hypothetical protein
MKDGTKRDSIDGYIVKYEQKKDLYKKLYKTRVKSNDDKNTSGVIFKEQVLD